MGVKIWATIVVEDVHHILVVHLTEDVSEAFIPGKD